jgi:GH15 family glucan-1,4-alpha-glucosidase
MPDRYPAIEDHAVVGDLHTVALVATDGTIDWCCLPQFDSPAVFASLLDADRGGCFAVRAEAARTRQLYMPDTNVLVTRFLGTDSVGEVVDFMVPRRPGSPLRQPGATSPTARTGCPAARARSTCARSGTWRR